MSQFEIVAEILNCNNIYKNHDEIILQKLDKILAMLVISAHDTIPVKTINNKKCIPGWNSFVKLYKGFFFFRIINGKAQKRLKLAK